MKDMDVANVALKGFLLSAFCFGFMDVWFLNLFYAVDPQIRGIWSKITYLGDAEWMLIGSLILGIGYYGQFRYKTKKHIKGRWKALRRSRQFTFIFAAVAITGITASLVKNSIGRARPYLIETAGPHGFSPFAFDSQWASWPSGHSTTAFAMATALALVAPKYRMVFLAIAAIAATSRAIIGAHYISDVIMGSTLGMVGTVLIYRWLDKKLQLTFYPRYPRNTQAAKASESDTVS